MAHPVALDPGPYRGTYKLIGGAPAIDFANLVSYRGTSRQHDWLEPPANAERWGEAAKLDVPVVTDVVRLREFREVLARTFLAVADGANPGVADIAAIGDLAAAGWARRRLRFPDGAPAAVWSDAAPSLLTELALDAASLLTSGEALGKVTACPECRWLFLDTSRNHSRRWCDPADCGNRARQRRHYQRRKQS